VNTIFYFDVGSPYAYLAAERIESILQGDVTWRALLLGGVFRSTGRDSWAHTARREAGMAEVQRRAAKRGLPSITWPDFWPNDGLLAMRAAVAAETLGRGADFALEAMRVQFRDGEPLSDPRAVSRAATDAGLDAEQVLQLATEQAIKERLRSQTEQALLLGVEGVPSIVCSDRAVFWGDDQLERAAAHLQAIRA
jgi:2-hydroxychromene-2-carboxylate isomerase